MCVDKKQYWEDYTEYFERKVMQAKNIEIETKQRILDDTAIASYAEKLCLQPDEMFLDFGCSFCRFYPYYKKIVEGRDNYFGTDIAKTPLLKAEKIYPELKQRKALKEMDGLHIPYGDNAFDKILCYGVFDACNQEFILFELLRVLKPDGMILITGKNINYNSDDEEAMIAEVNARKNGHPNFFTDVSSLIGQLKKMNVVINESNYYLYRGDFTEGSYITELPEYFYEWSLVLKKTKGSIIDKFTCFSQEFSHTFLEKQQKTKNRVINNAISQV